jgi:glucan phosphoethanolaminetransferase (alkaline phosphatase superfamily)
MEEFYDNLIEIVFSSVWFWFCVIVFMIALVWVNRSQNIKLSNRVGNAFLVAGCAGFITIIGYFVVKPALKIIDSFFAWLMM